MDDSHPQKKIRTALLHCTRGQWCTYCIYSLVSHPYGLSAHLFVSLYVAV